MRKLLSIMILVMFVGDGRIMAALTILDFEALAHSGESVNYSLISEDGFTLSTDDNRIVITGATGIPLPSGGYQPDSYKGSATAWTFSNHTTYLVKDDSDPFDLNFIDLARFSGHWTGHVAVTIIGYNDAGTQVANQSFTLPDTGDEALHTYALDSSFLGIYKASWTQDPDYFQFDNIVINVIPEPCTFLLFGLGAMASLRKRRQP